MHCWLQRLETVGALTVMLITPSAALYDCSLSQVGLSRSPTESFLRRTSCQYCSSVSSASYIHPRRTMAGWYHSLVLAGDRSSLGTEIIELLSDVVCEHIVYTIINARLTVDV